MAPPSSSSSPALQPLQTQLEQLRKRCPGSAFSSASVQLDLVPSDPEFVYLIDALRFVLHFLETPPRIEIRNDEIPEQLRKRVERRFELETYGSLVQRVERLDECLERWLGEEEVGGVVGVVRHAPAVTAPHPPPPAPKQAPSPPPAQRREAAAPALRAVTPGRRARELRQLQSRLGVSPLFRRLNETEYILPFAPTSRGALPVPLLRVERIRLVVPERYDAEPPEVAFLAVDEVPEEVERKVKAGFSDFVRANGGDVGIVAAVNVLAAKAGEWALREEKDVESEKEEPREEAGKEVVDEREGKGRLEVIQRPPEWSMPADEDDFSDEDEDTSATDSNNSDEDDKVEPEPEHAASRTPERGTSLSVPGVQISNIDLLQLSALNLIIKCTRCKTTAEVPNLAPSSSSSPEPRTLRCTKCTQLLAVAFRRELVHASSTRLGFFDLTNCTVGEILPSDFLPQCSQCASDAQKTELKGVVRGQMVFSNCRSCYAKLTLLIPELRLLRISSDGISADRLTAPRSSKSKETKYVVGQPLPDRGRCRHYRRSTRWFRFSCCGRVYPCDKCHDGKEQHPSEHANRMVCGMCAREQNYRPEDCRYCGEAFVKRRAGGRYWEGGKGTRDKVLMSRKDPRKWKRPGKAAE